MTTTVQAGAQTPAGGPIVTRPGVYDITAEAYHADRSSLSSTGARKILNSTPAKFKYELDHPDPPKKAFDIGTAAHRLILGDGPDLVLVDHLVWNTKQAKAEVAEAREAGAVPLKRDEWEQVHAMAAALRRHPLAAALFDPDFGKPEQSLFWTDKVTGVPCRARLDWLDNARGGRLLLPDLKTANDASTAKFERSVLDFRYDQQADFYMDAVLQLELADDVSFVFVVQEKQPPYLVNVIELATPWLLMAADRNKRAREIYAECTATGIWPGYGHEVSMASAPEWLQALHERGYRS
ncbi:PD-(D/E)XK nuclease-like domain-containing protein [Kitasatospora sp. NPDC048545]|uniref:PD-(D/E)XK nuclease-like domain-containing protein n=1 Tax=Kitasatospora sp. NPDC048545 TaxID=3157208 RepID=UPI0033FD89ED